MDDRRVRLLGASGLLGRKLGAALGRDPRTGTVTRAGRPRADHSAADWTRRGLLGAVAATLVAITLDSRSVPREALNGPLNTRIPALNAITEMPSQPPTPRKQLVPVRTLAASRPLAADGERVALRQLIIATDTDDYQLPGWQTVLDQIGTPYDILLAKRETLSTHSLVRSDGVGRYNAILLTSNALWYQNSAGQFVSSLSFAEWETLWEYERTFHIRQVAFNVAPGAGTEDYYLLPESEGPIGATPVLATLTSAGTKVFDRLNPAIQVPISTTYMYRTQVSSSDAEPLLMLDSDVIGVLSTAADGRERAALTFVLNPTMTGTNLLGYGLLRWATRGIFLGEERQWLNVDVDDWFNASVTGLPNKLNGGFRLSGPEAAATSQQQTELRRRHQHAAGFTLNLAYNGGRIYPLAPDQLSSKDTPDALTSYSKVLRGEFRWISHTLTHPQLNFTPYSENHREIRDNLVAAALIGLEVPATVLKPPEYSGLGVYDPHQHYSPTGPIQMPGAVTDFGLKAANKAFLKAASDLGIKYIVGDMSFHSERPSVFNGGIYIPVQPDLLLVPTWPVNVAFEATTPPEQVAWYNSLYGVNGTAQRSDRNFTYDEFLDREADVALGHVISGSAYAHTLHQSNLHEYAPGKSLLFDWLNVLVDKYSAYYQVPLRNPDWLSLATYARDRTEHFKALASGPDAVWDRVTNSVAYTPTADTTLFVTGLATQPATEADQPGPDEAETYGSDTISRLGLTGGQTLTFAVNRLS